MGDSGVGKTCLLVRFKDGAFLAGTFISTVGIDFRVRVEAHVLSTELTQPCSGLPTPAPRDLTTPLGSWFSVIPMMQSGSQGGAQAPVWTTRLLRPQRGGGLRWDALTTKPPTS